MDEEQQTRAPTAGDRLLATLGIDPNKWTLGDRRIALFAIVMILAIVIIAFCGYAFGWEWTGLTKRTFWDWLSLLIVPIVLALGGYLFNRSESRRTQELAEQRAKTDRYIADQGRQDDTLQAYLDDVSELLKDNELQNERPGDKLSVVARARTLPVMRGFDTGRKRIVVQFLYEAGLIDRNRRVINLDRVNLIEAGLNDLYLKDVDLSGAFLYGAYLRGSTLIHTKLSDAMLKRADLRGADLSDADLSGADLTGAFVSREQLDRCRSLEGATMPDGSKHP